MKLDWLSPEVEKVRRLREARANYDAAFEPYWPVLVATIETWIDRYNELAEDLLPRVDVEEVADSGPLTLKAAGEMYGVIAPDAANARVLWRSFAGSQRNGSVNVRFDKTGKRLVGKVHPSDELSPSSLARVLLKPLLFHELGEDPLAES